MADLKPADKTSTTRPQANRLAGISPGVLGLVAAVVIVALALVLFGSFNHKSTNTASQSPASSEFAKYNTAEAVANPNRTFKLVVNHETHKLASGPAVISLKQGDVVDITVMSDEDENSVNLEYYDVTTEAGNNADTLGHIKFVAYKTGTFRISDLGDENNPQPPGQYVLSTVEVK